MQRCSVLLPVARACQRWRVQLLAVAVVVFGAKLWLISVFAGPTPFWDQWDAEAASLFKPYIEGTLRFGSLLAPHNEHRLFWSRLLDLALLELNGRWDPIIEMIVNASLLAAAVSGLVAVLGAALGRTERLVLAVAAALLFALPFGWENTLSGFQSQFYFLLLFSLACLFCGADARAFSLRWWGTIALGVGAYFTMASGALTLVPVILVQAAQAVLRRGGWRDYTAIALGISLVALMSMTIPTTTIAAPLAAHSLSQFVSAFFLAMAWPFSSAARMRLQPGETLSLVLAALVINLPALSFAATHVARLRTADRSVWIYFLIGLWTAMQAAAIAYGRATGVQASRYSDILVVNLTLNVACLLYLVKFNKANLTKYATLVWATAVVVMVTMVSRAQLLREIPDKWRATQQETLNTSAFLATGDIAHLTDKPLLAIPYPTAERLAALASDPTIRSILPEDIMPAAERVQNSKLLLRGPLHSLFHQLREHLTVLGLFCFTIGWLVFACAGLVLISMQASGRRLLAVKADT
jgi:hypothetical protein